MSNTEQNNEINRHVKELSDATADYTGLNYFYSLIDYINRNLDMDHSLVFSIDQNNNDPYDLITHSNVGGGAQIDPDLINPNDFIHSINNISQCISINIPEALTTEYKSYASFILYNEHEVAIGLLIFLDKNEIFDANIVYEVIKSQVPRASAELDRFHTRNRLKYFEKSYNNLVDTTLDTIWETDKAGRIISINTACKAIYGYDERSMTGKYYKDFMTSQSGKMFDHNITLMEKGESLYNIISDHVTKDNEIIKVCYNILPKLDEYNNIIGTIGTTRDISASVRAQKIIKDNSELFSSILSRLPVIFFRIDDTGVLVDIRGNGLKRMGVDDMDWVGRPGYGLFIGMDEKIDSALSGNTVFFENKGTYKGTPWWFYTSMFFDNWSGYGAVGFSVDITDQKYVEEQLVELLKNNRKLAQRLVEVQEDERRNLARELHDELGQSITAVRSLATVITASSGDQNTEIKKLANSIIGLAGRLYEVVNNIMQRLRPDIIDGLDFEEAISNCIVRSQLETVGVNCDLTVTGDMDDLDEVVKITIYRIVQECLTNISKHAMASNVKIWIQRDSDSNNLMNSKDYVGLDRNNVPDYSTNRDTIKIRITDDGIGMDVEDKLNNYSNAKRHGLQGINERITAMGGNLDIDSEKGKGVQVDAVFVLGNRKGNIENDINNKINEIKNMRTTRSILHKVRTH